MNPNERNQHPAAAPYSPALARIVCVVATREGETVRTFVVDQNTRQGRADTAIAARDAMLCGLVFTTYRQDAPPV